MSKTASAGSGIRAAAGASGTSVGKGGVKTTMSNPFGGKRAAKRTAKRSGGSRR